MDNGCRIYLYTTASIPVQMSGASRSTPPASRPGIRPIALDDISVNRSESWSVTSTLTPPTACLRSEPCRRHSPARRLAFPPRCDVVPTVQFRDGRERGRMPLGLLSLNARLLPPAACVSDPLKLVNWTMRVALTQRHWGRNPSGGGRFRREQGLSRAGPRYPPEETSASVPCPAARGRWLPPPS